MKALYATLCVVIADQSTKLLVRGVQIPFLGVDIPGMPLYSSKKILGDLMRVTYVRNSGTAFGLGSGFTEFFAVFSLIASVAIFIYLYKIRKQGLGLRLSFALILGGAIGNMMDRVFSGLIFDGTALFHGRVVDFIDVNLFHLPFVFNIADAAVTIGVIMLIFFQGRTIVETGEVEMSRSGESGIVGQKGEAADAANGSNGSV